NPGDLIAFVDADGITNGNAKSNAGEDSAPWVKTDLRAGAALSGGGKTATWGSARLGQFPRPVRCKWTCRCSPNAALDGKFVARPGCCFRSSRLAFGTRP